MDNSYFKGHGLGNEYIVLNPRELTFRLTPGRIARICDREKGIGSDGILTFRRFPIRRTSACESGTRTGARRKPRATDCGFSPFTYTPLAGHDKTSFTVETRLAAW